MFKFIYTKPTTNTIQHTNHNIQKQSTLESLKFNYSIIQEPSTQQIIFRLILNSQQPVSKNISTTFCTNHQLQQPQYFVIINYNLSTTIQNYSEKIYISILSFLLKPTQTHNLCQKPSLGTLPFRCFGNRKSSQCSTQGQIQTNIQLIIFFNKGIFQLCGTIKQYKSKTNLRKSILARNLGTGSTLTRSNSFPGRVVPPSYGVVSYFFDVVFFLRLFEFLINQLPSVLNFAIKFKWGDLRVLLSYSFHFLHPKLEVWTLWFFELCHCEDYYYGN